MTFPEFLAAYRAGTMDRDASWRAYDMLACETTIRVRKALKMLRLAYAGELAIPEFMARYGIATTGEARVILSAWWVWSQVASGRRVYGLARRVPATLG